MEDPSQPSRNQLLSIIQIQTEIAKLGLDLGGVMQYVVEQTIPLIEADGAAIELAEEGMMVYRAASGIASGQLGLRLKMDGSLSGLCVKTSEMLYCEDSELDLRVDKIACQQVGLRSMIVVPLKHKGLTVGVLKAMATVPSKFNAQDMQLLAMMTEVVAAAMYFSVKYDSDNLFLMATRDGLTGLANRALFMDRLRSAVFRAGREQNPSGVLMIDMNGLKLINDTYGHRVGDAILVEFSSRLKKATRSTDTTARLGGDEFGVILTPLGPMGTAPTLERIESEFTPPFVFEDKHFQINASIGAVLIPEDGVEPDKVLELADQRMYAAKQSRNSTVRDNK